MPRGPVPERFHDILTSTTLGHLATIGADGAPRVNPVWFIWDDPDLLVGVKADALKYRNLRRDPRLAISFGDSNNPGRYVELRGQVVEFNRYLDLSFVNQLSQKYTGKNVDPAEEGTERYKLTIRVDAWTGQ